MVRVISGIVILLTSLGTVLRAQCEASAPVRYILNNADPYRQTGLSKAERTARQTAILKDGLAQHPDDYFLLRRQMLAQDSKDAEIRWAKLLYEKSPDRPVWALLYAQALVGRDTPEAIRMLEALKAAHPDMPRVYYALANIAAYGTFKDKERAQREVEGFLKLCPATFDDGVLQRISASGTAEQIARTAAALRKRLENETDPLLRDTWEQLWSMEFKAHPPAEHASLRRQIAQDLARFEKFPQRHELDWMSFLRAGYESLGDQQAMDKISDEILKNYPASDDAKDLVQERWHKEHPFPKGDDKAQKEAYQRALLTAAGEWHRQWPDDSMILYERFEALEALEDTPVKLIADAADQMIATYRRNPNWYGATPVEFQVADAFVKRKIRLDQVPSLVEEGYRTALARTERGLDVDRDDAERKKSVRESIDYLKIEKARVLLDYYKAAKQTGKVREVVAELDAVNPSRPFLKSILLARRAQAAELEGRKLDALLLYRAAVEARGVTPPSPDPLAENVDRLWKELGGTPAAYALLSDKTKAAEVTDSRWERPKNPIPAFSLPDLEGKTWSLASMEGKAVLINIWATWCGPCRAEHPEFQKLYEKLKDRTDVSVLSFNVDDDLGKVAPYMKENKYTFPVILGRDVVDVVVPVLAIPRNWFINPKGKLEWEQIGFGSDPKWQETMTGKLEEVLKSGR